MPWFLKPNLKTISVVYHVLKVKSQTENYVNNTGKNLGTMEGQVEGLTDRVADVDSSLNYMVGQLSLVVQEFNQVLHMSTSLMNG